MTQLEPKNKHWGLDKGEVTEMWGRKLYRVVAIASITPMNVQEGQRGGWCSEEAIVGERVQWVPPMATFWGGTFRGGTFEGGTFWRGTFEGGTFGGGNFGGGTFRGGTFRGGTFGGGTFGGGTFWGGTFEGGTFWGGTFRRGTFQGGTFWGGTFWGGTFWRGTFEGGTFWGGTFRGGTFRGGTVATRSPISLSGLRWEITITDQHMTIGCQHHELKRWWQFEDRVIARMDADALEFWQAHKAALQTLCKGTDRVSEADGEAEA